MVRINTSQQKVDEKKYGDGYDRIFRSGKDILDAKEKRRIPIEQILANMPPGHIKVLDDPVEPMKAESIWGTILLGVFSGLVVGFFICALIWLGLQ